MPEDFKSRLKGKVLIVGIGNRMRSDDGVGSILAERIKDKVPFVVLDTGASPENYLEKIIKEKPDTVLFIDAVEFAASPGQFKILEADKINSLTGFSTHNSSIQLSINYLQSNLKADIMMLIIQPKAIILGEGLSSQVEESLKILEQMLHEAGQEKGCRIQ